MHSYFALVESFAAQANMDQTPARLPVSVVGLTTLSPAEADLLELASVECRAAISLMALCNRLEIPRVLRFPQVHLDLFWDLLDLRSIVTHASISQSIGSEQGGSQTFKWVVPAVPHLAEAMSFGRVVRITWKQAS